MSNPALLALIEHASGRPLNVDPLDIVLTSIAPPGPLETTDPNAFTLFTLTSTGPGVTYRVQGAWDVVRAQISAAFGIAAALALLTPLTVFPRGTTMTVTGSTGAVGRGPQPSQADGGMFTAIAPTRVSAGLYTIPLIAGLTLSHIAVQATSNTAGLFLDVEITSNVLLTVRAKTDAGVATDCDFTITAFNLT